MNRKCSSLRYGEDVVFLCYSDIYKKKIYEIGSVDYVYGNSVAVCWLEGYRNREDDIPFSDMIAVHNPDGEYMEFDNISGNSDLLIPE